MRYLTLVEVLDLHHQITAMISPIGYSKKLGWFCK